MITDTIYPFMVKFRSKIGIIVDVLLDYKFNASY